MQIDAIPDVFCIWDHYLAAKSEQEGIFLYDLDTGEEIEDDVLTDFVKQNYAPDSMVFSSTYTIFPAEDGGIYLAGASGLHRHVIGGAVMEQVINGGLCGLSDPSEPVSVMTRTANEGFLAAFSKGKMSSFTYDPNMPSMPEESLKVYSLEDSYGMRTAIAMYQIAKPNVHVEYEIGRGEDNGVTREDALKKLNTRIVAGEGPDVLLMDGLPVDSYIEKGLLLGLNEFLEGVFKEEEFFENLVRAFAHEGSVYMVPMQAGFPVMLGRAGYVSGMKNLSDVADEVEKCVRIIRRRIFWAYVRRKRFFARITERVFS